MTSGARPRIAPLRGTEWSDEARAFLRGHLSRADRHLSGDLEASPPPPILGLLARHPAVGGAWLGFSGTLIEGGSLAERDR
ncbi:MAG TPA: hypothetical protein VEJ87_02890, partial [Acidimicrobiales bacterium]|nr:hypothetical protein [Acidimicrobiales bacterium]